MRANECLSGVTQNYLGRYSMIRDKMVSEMTGAEMTDSLSHDFIVQMLPHHMAAIEMSRNLLQYTTFIPLQDIASDIVNEQTEGIEKMRALLDECGNVKNSRWDICMYRECYEQISQTMFFEMANARAVNNINADFIYEMVPHHEGAIRMSENLLRFKICPGLVPILESIIASQRKGVCEMKNLLRCV